MLSLQTFSNRRGELCWLCERFDNEAVGLSNITVIFGLSVEFSVKSQQYMFLNRIKI